MSYQEPPAGGPYAPPGGQPGAYPPPGGYPPPGQQPPPGAYPPPGSYPPPGGYPPPGQQPYPGQPAQYPPPGQQYPQQGYPQYAAPTPRARKPFNGVPFDAAIVGLGLLTLLFSHFAFYRIPSAGGDLKFNLDAYHGFVGWLGVWLTFLGAAAIVVPLLGRQVNFPLRLVALGVAALGLVLLVIAAFVRPDFGLCDGEASCTNPVKVGATYWIDVVLAIGVTGLLAFTFVKEKQRA